MGGTTAPGGLQAPCAQLVECNQGPKGLRLDRDEGDPYLHRLLGPPLEDEAPPLVGVSRPTYPTIESRVTIRKDDLDQWAMKVMGEYTLDRGWGESPEAFSADHPPPIDGPLIGMVSHPPIVPINEVIFFMYRCSCYFSSLN